MGYQERCHQIPTASNGKSCRRFSHLVSYYRWLHERFDILQAVDGEISIPEIKNCLNLRCDVAMNALKKETRGYY